MADIPRIQIIAEVDERASASRIEAQLPSISKQVKERVKVGLEIDQDNIGTDVSKISKQINAATKKNAGRVNVPVELSVQADTLKRLLDQQVKTLKKRAEKIEAPLDWAKFNKEFGKNTLPGFQQARKELGILRAETESWGAGLAKLIPMNPAENISKYIDELSVNTKKLHAGFSNLRGGIPKEAVTSFEQLAVAQKELSAIPATDIESRSKKYNEAASILNKLSVSYRDLKTATIEASAPVVADTLAKRFEKAKFALEEFKNKYSAFLTDPKLVAQYNNLVEQAGTIDLSSLTAQKDVQNLSAGMQRFEAASRAAGKAQRSLGDEMVNNAKKMASWMFMGGGIASAFRFLRDIVTNVQELNKAFVDLQIVTNGSNEEVAGLLSSYSKLAKQLGATTIEVANSAAGWLRQGKSIEDTNALIKNTIILSKVGGIEAAASTEYLTSASKGYNVAVKDTLSIVDKVSAVDLKAAVSAAGLAEGMSEVANNANLAGVSMDKLLGYLAAVGEVTQDPMSEVGHSFSTMLSRMGNIKLARLDSFSNNGEDLNNVETVLRGVGISLRDGINSFRDFSSVLDEVAGKWSSYTEVEQRALATAFASKNNMEDFFVLMQNYSKATEYSAAATNSAGTALQKFGSYQEGIEAKQKKLTANMEAFSSVILDSDLIKNSYDTGSGILGYLTEVTKLLGALPTLGTAVAAALSIGNKGLIKTVQNGDNLSGKSLSFGIKSDFKQLIQSDMALMTQYQQGWKTASDEVTFFNDTLGKASVAAQEQAAALKNGTTTSQVWGAQQLTSAKAAGVLGIQSKIASVGVGILKTAMNALVGFGIALAIQGITTGIDHLVNAQKEAIEKSKELTDEWTNQSDKLKSMQKFITENGDELEKLGKGIGSFGDNIGNNADEYARYNEIANEAAKLFPELISGWTNEGNAILKTKGSIESLTKSYKDAIKAQQEKVLLDAPDVLKGFQTEMAQSATFVWENEGYANQISLLQKILPLVAQKDKDAIGSIVSANSNAIEDILKGANIDDSLAVDSVFNTDAIMSNGDTLVSYLKTLVTTINASLANLRSIPESYIGLSDDYNALSDETKSVVSNIVTTFDSEWYSQFGGDISKLKLWLQQNLLNIFSDANFSTALSDIMSSKSSFDTSEISIDAYQGAIDSFLGKITNLSPEIQDALSKIFSPDIESMVGRAKELLQDQFDEQVGTITLEDLTIAYKLENKGPISWEEFLAQIAKVKEQSTLGIDALTASMTSLTNAQSVAAEVMKFVSESGSISAENYKKLTDADSAYADAVDTSSGYLTVNAQKIDEINKKKAEQLYSDTQLAKSKALTEYQANALELVTKQEMLNQAREQGLDMNQDWIKDLETEIKTLKGTQNGIEENILGMDRLTGQIIYATSAYKKWIDVQNIPESGDQYRNTVEAFAKLKELLKERKVGTQEYKAASELLIPQEVLDKGTKAIEKYTKDYGKYFTDGSKGALQFAKDLAKTDLAKFDPKTKQFELFSTSLSEIATTMNVTEDAAYSFFQLLNEYLPEGQKFIFDNPQFDSTEQIDAVKAAADAYGQSKDAAEAAQKELEQAKTDAEKALAQQKLDAANQQQKKAEQDLYNASVGVGKGTPEEITIQQQLDVINKTLADLHIEIPATVKFNTAAEVAKILDPFKDPKNQIPPMTVTITEDGSATVIGQFAVVSGAADNLSGTTEDPTVTVVVGEDGTQTVLTNLTGVQTKGQEISNTPVIVSVKYVEDNAASRKVEEQIKSFYGDAEEILMNGTQDEKQQLYSDIVDAKYAFLDSIPKDGEMPFGEDTIDALTQRWNELIGFVEKYYDVYTQVAEPNNDVPIPEDESESEKVVEQEYIVDPKYTIDDSKSETEQKIEDAAEEQIDSATVQPEASPEATISPEYTLSDSESETENKIIDVVDDSLSNTDNYQTEVQPEVKVSPKYKVEKDSSSDISDSIIDNINSALDKSLGGNVSPIDYKRLMIKVTKENEGTINTWSTAFGEKIGDTLDDVTQVFSDENGLSVLVTPILPNGELLTQKQLSDYAEKLLSGGKENLLNNDTLGIVTGLFDSGNIDQSESDAVDLAFAIENLATQLSILGDLSGVSLVIETSDAQKTLDNFVSGNSNRTITIQAKVQPFGVALDSGRGVVKRPETALVAEKRPEILVRGGKFQLLENPQLLNLKPSDQLIGGAETEKILKGKSAKNSGRALDNPGWFSGAVNSVSNFGKTAVSGILDLLGIGKSSGGKSKSDGSAAFLKTIENWIDWFPRILEVAKKTTEQFQRLVDNAIGYARKNGALDKVITSVRDEIAKNEEAAAVYQRQADEIATQTKLSADWIQKIQNGSPEVEVVTDKKLKEKIDAYTEWYDKAQAVRDALVDLREQENELAKQRLDNILTDYENRTNRIDAKINAGQTGIDRKTALGRQVKAEDYLPMLNAASSRLSTLTEERRVLNAEFESLVSSGVIKKDSDVWHQYTGEIESLDGAISQAGIDIQGFKDSIAAIDVTNIQYATTALEQERQARENLMALRDAQGTSNTKGDYNALIKTTDKMIVNWIRANELLKQQQKNLDPLSEKYQEIQSQINDNVNNISQAKTEQEGWNDAIKDIEINKLTEQKDALNKINEEHQRSVDLQQAQEDLAKAQQRRIRILKDGQFVYEADQKAITDAQNKLDDLRNQAILDKIDDAIDAIEDSKKTDNLYDANGNKIPQYASGGPVNKTGLALLHNGEFVLSNKMLAGLQSVDLSKQIAADLMPQLTNMNLIAPIQKPLQITISPSIGDITVSGKEEIMSTLRNVFSNVEQQVQQKLYEH